MNERRDVRALPITILLLTFEGIESVCLLLLSLVTKVTDSPLEREMRESKKEIATYTGSLK